MVNDGDISLEMKTVTGTSIDNIAVNLGCITIPISISSMEGLLSWHKKNHTVLPYEMCDAMLYCIETTTTNSVCHK